MRLMKIVTAVAVLTLSTALLASGGAPVALEKAPIDFCDKASLQRGAGLYMNYCAGCHSLQYARYSDVADAIGVIDKEGNRNDAIIKSHMNFVTSKVTDPIVHSMRAEDAAKWFGVNPPDLSLVTRSRGSNWVYTYLKSFYHDPKRPFGVNNTVFPDVGMPHVLLDLQGLQEPVIETIVHGSGESARQEQKIVGFNLTQPGRMTPAEYNQAVGDLVNFLDYIGEPAKSKREHLGVFVLLFLIIFTVFAYLLKREYWKDVH